jgi:hypothetical protein
MGDFLQICSRCNAALSIVRKARSTESNELPSWLMQARDYSVADFDPRAAHISVVILT